MFREELPSIMAEYASILSIMEKEMKIARTDAARHRRDPHQTYHERPRTPENLQKEKRARAKAHNKAKNKLSRKSRQRNK